MVVVVFLFGRGVSASIGGAFVHGVAMLFTLGMTYWHVAASSQAPQVNDSPPFDIVSLTITRLNSTGRRKAALWEKAFGAKKNNDVRDVPWVATWCAALPLVEAWLWLLVGPPSLCGRYYRCDSYLRVTI